MTSVSPTASVAAIYVAAGSVESAVLRQLGNGRALVPDVRLASAVVARPLTGASDGHVGRNFSRGRKRAAALGLLAPRAQRASAVHACLVAVQLVVRAARTGFAGERAGLGGSEVRNPDLLQPPPTWRARNPR